MDEIKGLGITAQELQHKAFNQEVRLLACS